MISRSSADRKLSRLISRVEAVNAYPDSVMLYSFVSIWVFGSYLTGAPIEHLDICYDLRRRPGWSEAAACALCKTRFMGPRWSWSACHARKMLRGGDACIRAVAIYDAPGSPMRLIFSLA
jgi:hypothetical protein